MDLKIFLSAFVMIFLAEIGDKTQLGVVGLVAKSGSPVAVFFGAITALICATLLGVLFGGILLKFLPIQYIKVLSGIIFIAVGVFIIFK